MCEISIYLLDPFWFFCLIIYGSDFFRSFALEYVFALVESTEDFACFFILFGFICAGFQTIIKLVHFLFKIGLCLL